MGRAAGYAGDVGDVGYVVGYAGDVGYPVGYSGDVWPAVGYAGAGLVGRNPGMDGGCGAYRGVESGAYGDVSDSAGPP
jgi:hypothetical protein